MGVDKAIENKARKFIETQLREEVVTLEVVGGGFIAKAFKAITKSGVSFFVKGLPKTLGSTTKDRTFEREAYALELIAPYFKVPKVYATSEEFLVLEWVEAGSTPKNGYQSFGRSLARMHKEALSQTSGPGFPFDNTIGATLQLNENRHGKDALMWPAFFWEMRLSPQLEWAIEKGLTFEQSEIDHLKERVLGELSSIKESCVSLLHGDLWGGNHKFDEEGNPWIFDPASYYGHREADLAMMRLFGGFPIETFESYDQDFPLEEGHEKRLSIYQLYHVLNHVNLFGSSYIQQAKDLIKGIR